MSRGLEFDGSADGAAGALRRSTRSASSAAIIDYTVGPPLVKVYVLAEHDDPKQRHYLSLYKMGEGPLYPFWIPYHLVHFEAPNAIARVVLFGDELAKPLGRPVVEVCAVAKRDLKAGETLDEYGDVHDLRRGGERRRDEPSAATCPKGSSRAARCVRDIPQDEVLTYDDVELPAGRLADRLRAEQYRHFRGETWLEELLNAAPTADDATRLSTV